MAIYQHVLIGVDFSTESAVVVDKALQLAESMGAQVGFIHVVEYTGYLYPPDTPFPVELNIEQQFVDKAEERLRLLAQEKNRADAERLVEVGSPTHEIVRVAKQKEVDLIILGTHGRHGIQRILGSTVSGVMHIADCDVLAIRVGRTR